MVVRAQEITGYSSTMTIAEIDPARPGAATRVLVLTGSGLPKRGADWPVEQVVVTTWYPGNGDEGTQQVLGPKEMPSAWEGTWRRTLLGSTPILFTDSSGQTSQLIDPMTIREVFEDICRQGMRLRVVWAIAGTTLLGTFLNGKKRDESFKILREGRLKSFSAPIDRHTDINWKMEFEWVSRGKKQQKVARPNQDEDLAYISNSMIASQQATIEAIQKKFGISSKTAQHLTIGQLVDIVEAPANVLRRQLNSLSSNLAQVQKVGSLAQTLAHQPLTVVNQLIAFGRRTQVQSNAFLKSTGQIPAELFTTKPGSVSATLRNVTYYGNLEDSTELERRQGVDLQALIRNTTINVGNRAEVAYTDTRSTRQNDILAVYVAREGDTPEMVSQKFYNTPDRAQDILRANRMSWYEPKFKKGQILTIPTLSSNQFNRTA